MNLAHPWTTTSKTLFRLYVKARRLLPKRKSLSFDIVCTEECPKIQSIYVINLDRQPGRMAELERELKQVLDTSGSELWGLTKRQSAIDAMEFSDDPVKDLEVDPIYTLGDQLFVEPQPQTFPSRFDLGAPINMSRPEVAVARSHIDIWRQVAVGIDEYVLILEDDVWLKPDFTSHLDKAWEEIKGVRNNKEVFDILYLSYVEVKNGAPKTFISENVFSPTRGLWHLSGYVLTRKGAQKLINLLPCKGPVDLWINHQFDKLNVLATSRSIIKQRRDTTSTNSYSVLPALTKIGAIDSEGASLFHIRPSSVPVIATGSKDSGLTSLAMALSMLGYRCCSDLESLPQPELHRLLSGSSELMFNAYVNVGFSPTQLQTIREKYPRVKIIITTGAEDKCDDGNLKSFGYLDDADMVVLDSRISNKWQIICEHLEAAPPASVYPDLPDIGQRPLLKEKIEKRPAVKCKVPKRDDSPWIVQTCSENWQGIGLSPIPADLSEANHTVNIKDSMGFLDSKHWFLRDDTFTDNLALFRPSSVDFRPGIGAAFNIQKAFLGVRDYSAGALTSRNQYLYGKFEATFQASNVPGTVTGFFLHRNSPRQEIDIEITGNRTDRLLVNVFYNPGIPGTKYDYGYRGAATYIDLGFDASLASHSYAIEWGPGEICWFIDDRLVYRRVEWDPTPIPHLPMSLHMNTWPTRSSELAGKLSSRRLPATTFVRSISLSASLGTKNGM